MDYLTFRAARPVSIFGLPKPTSFTPWQPPFTITPQVSVSRDDWYLGDWNAVDELDEEAEALRQVRVYWGESLPEETA